MELLDPATGQPLPSDAIQRVLFVANTVHIYNIPPIASTRGHSASSWTEDPSRHIFTARLRAVETSYESASATTADKLKVDLVLEDPASGQLFAAAPYISKASVEPVYDSSRFFAVSVRDPQGRKATLGIGFEDRSDAFDLSVALQEARRGLGWEGEQNKLAAKKDEETKDYSLKKGETITINLGGTSFGRRRSEQQQSSPSSSSQAPVNLQAFALAPPPGASSSGGSSGGFSLPPPPGNRSSHAKSPSAQDLGFDDGKFGEFS